MKPCKQSIAAVITGLCIAGGAASAGEMYAYPPKARTQAQQKQDQFECHQWAVEQTKFDPVQFATQTAPMQPTPPAQSQAVGQAHGAPAVVAGAAQGVAVAGISGGDLAHGAAVGAGLRGLRQQMSRRETEEKRAKSQLQAQVQVQQQQAQRAQELQSKQLAYDRARGVCFKARGYTVSGD